MTVISVITFRTLPKGLFNTKQEKMDPYFSNFKHHLVSVQAWKKPVEHCLLWSPHGPPMVHQLVIFQLRRHVFARARMQKAQLEMVITCHNFPPIYSKGPKTFLPHRWPVPLHLLERPRQKAGLTHTCRGGAKGDFLREGAAHTRARSLASAMLW